MDNSIKKQKIKKWTTVVILDLALVFIAILIFILIVHPFSQTPIKIDGVYIHSPQQVAQFNLMDQYGQSFSNQQLKGHWTLMFFGFTHCQFVCPTTFAALNKMYLSLQQKLPSQLLPQIVFITVDPANDTIARLNQYVNSYNPHFFGLRGDSQKTKALENELAISVANANGSIEHNTNILVINPQMQIQAYLTYPHRPERMINDYQQIIQLHSSQQKSAP